MRCAALVVAVLACGVGAFGAEWIVIVKPLPEVSRELAVGGTYEVRSATGSGAERMLTIGVKDGVVCVKARDVLVMDGRLVRERDDAAERAAKLGEENARLRKELDSARQQAAELADMAAAAKERARAAEKRADEADPSKRVVAAPVVKISEEEAQDFGLRGYLEQMALKDLLKRATGMTVEGYRKLTAEEKRLIGSWGPLLRAYAPVQKAYAAAMLTGENK